MKDVKESVLGPKINKQKNNWLPKQYLIKIKQYSYLKLSIYRLNFGHCYGNIKRPSLQPFQAWILSNSFFRFQCDRNQNVWCEQYYNCWWIICPFLMRKYITKKCIVKTALLLNSNGMNFLDSTDPSCWPLWHRSCKISYYQMCLINACNLSIYIWLQFHSSRFAPKYNFRSIIKFKSNLSTPYCELVRVV